VQFGLGGYGDKAGLGQERIAYTETEHESHQTFSLGKLRR